MTRPLLLDLFCCAGVGADGYIAAGFDVVGVDTANQRHYPGQFVQADALEVLDMWDLSQFAAIHASPPCQSFTRARALSRGKPKFGDLLTPTIARLRQLDIPWIVENVPGAPGMEGSVTLCGSAFGLEVQRHRLFLSNVPITGTKCQHHTFPIDPDTGKPRSWGVYWNPGPDPFLKVRIARDAEHGCQVMGVDRPIPWNALKEGIPPAYTYYLGRQLLDSISTGV